MRFSSIILGLAAVASAVDIRFFSGSKCGGGALVQCGNQPPNKCCQNSYKVNSVGVYAIPSNWKLVTRSYRNGNSCASGDKVHEFNSNGATWVCHGTQGIFNGDYRGAGYSFLNKRRATDTSDDQECAKPDTLFLEDGQKYNIAGLGDAETEEMVSCLA